jgi:hypothetical protein
MNSKASNDSRTRLSDKTYERCMAATIRFLDKNPSIRNRELREITGIDYDQAINFFNRAIFENRLIRKGQSSGTHYVRPKRSEK